MVDRIVDNLTAAVHVVFDSIMYVINHRIIIVYSACTALLSFILSLLLFHGLELIHVALGLPMQVLTKLLGFCLFNFFYAIVIRYVIQYQQKIVPAFFGLARSTYTQLPSLIAWSTIVTLGGVIFNMIFYLASLMLAGAPTFVILIINFILRLLFGAWFFINFLCIAALISQPNLRRAMQATAHLVKKHWILLLATTAIFYTIEPLLARCIFILVKYTPSIIGFLHLLRLTNDMGLTLIAIIAIIGMMLTSLLSIGMFALQSVLVAHLYLRFIGRSLKLQDLHEKSIYIIRALVIFCIIVLMISIGLTLSAFYIPSFGRLLLFLFT